MIASRVRVTDLCAFTTAELRHRLRIHSLFKRAYFGVYSFPSQLALNHFLHCTMIFPDKTLPVSYGASKSDRTSANTSLALANPGDPPAYTAEGPSVASRSTSVGTLHNDRNLANNENRLDRSRVDLPLPDLPKDSLPSEESAQSSNKKRKIKKGASPAQLLSPPPECFHRQPPQQPYPFFHPLAHIALGTYLEAGFPPVIPPSSTIPHPFITHDVATEDWERFVGDLQIAASLSISDKVTAYGIPMPITLCSVGIGLPIGQ